jgi:hypothetical protein
MLDSKGAISGTPVVAGTFATASLLASDAANKSFTTVGNGNFIDFGQVYGFAGNASFSVELLVNPALVFAGRPIIGRYAVGLGWRLQCETSGGALGMLRDGTDVSSGGAPLVVGTTVHIVYTYDGSVSRFYTNGSLLAAVSQAAAVTLPTSFDSLRLGRPADTNVTNHIIGTYDEVAIYNVALDAATILAHHNAR